MNSDAPQMPGTFELPPATAVPPITTTAIDISRYSAPILSAAPPEKLASRKPAIEASTAQST